MRNIIGIGLVIFIVILLLSLLGKVINFAFKISIIVIAAAIIMKLLDNYSKRNDRF
ncbi:hypothetical protein [Lagierella sp.]|uniref:hypothetical protein n=1 Tax=Lagierella sp. TaxID=2849657 RepID=UPI002628E08E|nr:hypothetical protein [Lagierella sp.]